MHLLAEIAGFRRYGRYTAGTAGIFSGTKQGGICTDLLAGTVYTGHTGRYGTKLTSLFSIVIKLLKIKSSEMLQIF